MAVLALAGVAAPAGGGEPANRTLTVTKVVDGPGPDGGYAIEVECELEDGSAVYGFGTTFSDGTTEVFELQDGAQTCTVTETDPGGADEVVYQCADSPPGALCQGDRAVRITTPDGDAAAAVTVTNTFADVVPAEDPPPDVIPATPAFTG